LSTAVEPIFGRLRSILTRQAAGWSVTEDSSQRYCLDGRVGPASLKAWRGKMRRPTLPVAWVQRGKGYVSFHLMGASVDPTVFKNISKGLRARMQGKTCFNFKQIDEPLFQELEQLTDCSCQAFKRAGFVE